MTRLMRGAGPIILLEIYYAKGVSVDWARRTISYCYLVAVHTVQEGRFNVLPGLQKPTVVWLRLQTIHTFISSILVKKSDILTLGHHIPQDDRGFILPTQAMHFHPRNAFSRAYHSNRSKSQKDLHSLIPPIWNIYIIAAER